MECGKFFARFALCGSISDYTSGAAKGPRHLANAITRSMRLQGFIVSNYFDMMPEYSREVAAWSASGEMTWRQTVVEGLDRAPEAFLKLFSGENLGKMLVKLD